MAKNLFEDCEGLINRRNGTVVFRRAKIDHTMSLERLERMVEELEPMARKHRVAMIDCAVDCLAGLIRFYAPGSMFALLCRPEQLDEARTKLIHMTPAQLTGFGGGLSAASTFEMMAEASEVKTAEQGCGVGLVVDFLNNVFDVLFENSDEKRRFSYGRGLVHGIEKLGFNEFGRFVARSDQESVCVECCSQLSRRFEVLIKDLGLEKLRSVQNSPISNPPWTTETLRSAQRTAN